MVIINWVKKFFQFQIVTLVLLEGTFNSWAQEFYVSYNGGERSSWLPSVIKEGVDYVSIQDLAELLDARTYYSDKARKVILYLGSKEIKVTALNPFVVIDQQVYQLPIDTRYVDAEIFVPLIFFVNLIAKVYPGQIILDAVQRKLEIYYGDLNVKGLEIEEKVNGTLIRILVSKPFKSSDVSTRLRHDWLYVDIYGGKIDSASICSYPVKGMIEKIVPLQVSPEMAQISFKLRGDLASGETYVSQTNDEILVSLHTKKELSDDILKDLEKARKRWLIDKVVIDPGHGGKDPGAIGPTGIPEKDVTLKIARKLKRLLEEELGIEVIMTREDDQFVPLNERTSLANKVGAKLFISIHANANKNPRVGGCTTYFLGPASTEEALEVARRENSVIKYESSQDVYADLSTENFILSAMAQMEYNRESQHLAAMIQREMDKSSGIYDRGVKQAGYYVLIGASMPNVLVEVAFISNPKEERLLKSSEFHDKVAEALLASIKKFKTMYERGI